MQLEALRFPDGRVEEVWFTRFFTDDYGNFVIVIYTNRGHYEFHHYERRDHWEEHMLEGSKVWNDKAGVLIDKWRRIPMPNLIIGFNDEEDREE